ncbi:hypothetical protein X801_08625 [Opisthorchis viverrini]|uniref:Uncharacterized protein n=1 Tax=Opisthorchis viverrini TaxID=6198 RepID=A0A1S8WM76_OPIVI|nr:hypothetical protein X801_08625 [Opisthorchis viverrini]
MVLLFRKERVALSANIEETLMQVRVPENDRGALRFLWWPGSDISLEPVEFQMNSHVFGANYSPFCANFALHQIVELFENDYALIVSEAIRNNFCVHECLLSDPSIDAAKMISTQLTEMFLKPGFHLRKWVTNAPEAIENLFSAKRAESPVTLSGCIPVMLPTPGIRWDTLRDNFCFQYDIPTGPHTRRGILSSLCSLFDPPSVVATLCIPPKQFLQRLCRTGLGWCTGWMSRTS